MNKKIFSLMATSTMAIFILGACATSAPQKNDEVTPRTEASAFTRSSVAIDRTKSAITFTGKSNIIDHEGAFETFDAKITLDSDKPSDLSKANVEITIEVASIKTDNEGLKKHLLRDDFFNAEKYPTATFASKTIESKGGYEYAIAGDLTIKGTVKTVTFNATISNEQAVIAYDLPRQDFGIGNDSYGNKLLNSLVPVSATFVFMP